MTIDITKPLDTELARTLPGYIRETRAAIEGAVTDSSTALAAVGILENEVDNLAALIAAALVKFPNQGVFVDGDATPSVSGGIIYRTANTTSTAITYLDGGFAGQMVIIVADDENTTVVHNPGYIILEGGVSITFNANQGIILVCHENSIGNKQWVQVGSIGGGSSTGNAKFNRDTFTVGAGGQSSFDTSVAFQTGQKLMFPYVNGELQPSSKFTEVDSNTITFGETLPEGTFVELVYITTLSVTTSVDDLFVVNKPYLDVRQYNSLSEANTAATLQNKLLVVSTSQSVAANLDLTAKIHLLPGGAIEIAAGYNTVFSGGVTLEAGAEIDSASGTLSFTGFVDCKGGTIKAAGAISVTGAFRADLYNVFTGSGAVTFGSGSVTEVYPEWWGAVGDGVADDNLAVQSAVNAHTNVCGVPGGIYACSAGIQLAISGSRIDGKGCTFKHTGAIPHHIFSADGVSDVTIRNLSIDGNMATITGADANRWLRDALVFIRGSNNVTLDSLEIFNSSGTAIQLQAGASNGVGACITNNWLHDSDNRMIYVGGYDDVTITNNRIYNSYTHGIAVFAEGSSTSNAIISNNTVELMKHDSTKTGSGLGITVWSAATYGMSGVVVTGNNVTNCQSMNYSLTSFKNTTDSGTMVVTGNYAYGATKTSPSGGGVNYELRGRCIAFTGNISINPQYTHIVITDADTFNITGNSCFQDTRMAALVYGIDAFVSAASQNNKNVVISGNIFTNSSGYSVAASAPIAIRFSGTTRTSGFDTDVIIDSNIIRGDWSQAIWCSVQVDKMQVSNNKINVNTLATVGRTVYLKGVDLKIHRNDIINLNGQAAIAWDAASPAADLISVKDNITTTSGASAYGIFANGATTSLVIGGNDVRGVTKHTADFFGAFNVTTVLDLGGNSWNYDTAAPAGGYHKEGSRVVRMPPVVGQPKAWSCTALGTPGTWVSEGNL